MSLQVEYRVAPVHTPEKYIWSHDRECAEWVADFLTKKDGFQFMMTEKHPDIDDICASITHGTMDMDMEDAVEEEDTNEHEYRCRDEERYEEEEEEEEEENETHVEEEVMLLCANHTSLQHCLDVHDVNLKMDHMCND